ncbi:MAG TPA: hypothetical protein VH114_06220 [Candidatus Acidoferrum sp.]|jgi:hypothetical protein|nr:hypothetical protein [Candidatus Acidoferrum sp.]
MQSQDLVALIDRLSPQERSAVEEFIRFLKEKSQPAISFRTALDSFVREHPELLRRLAQ